MFWAQACVQCQYQTRQPGFWSSWDYLVTCFSITSGVTGSCLWLYAAFIYNLYNMQGSSPYTKLAFMASKPSRKLIRVSTVAKGFGTPLFLSARKWNCWMEAEQNKMAEENKNSEICVPLFSMERWNASKLCFSLLYSLLSHAPLHDTHPAAALITPAFWPSPSRLSRPAHMHTEELTLARLSNTLMLTMKNTSWIMLQEIHSLLYIS